MAQIHHDSKGYWRFSKGFVEKQGKRVQKHHSLGPEKRQAQILANYIEAEWCSIPGEETQKVWDADALNRAKENANRSSSKTPSLATPNDLTWQPAQTQPQQFQPPTPAKQQLTLFQAFDLYKVEMDGRAAAKDCSEAHARSTIEKLHQAKRLYHDCPLVCCDDSYLKKIRRAITARPLTIRFGEPKPISIATVQNWLTALGMFFDFAARYKAPTPDNPKAKLWTPDEIDWRQNFNISAKDQWTMMTEDERRASNDPLPTYNLEQIGVIWDHAVPLDRLYLLLGITCGWTPADISSWRKDEVKIINGEMYIHKNRGKTGIPGKWWCCPELKSLIEQIVSQTPDRPDKLCLVDDRNHPLLSDRNDAVGNRWGTIRRNLPKGMPSYSFKCLRKLGGQLIYNRSKSNDFVQLFEAHKRVEISQIHYVGADRKVGNLRTTTMVQGKPLTIGCNCYIAKD